MRAEEYPHPSSPAASAVMRGNRKTGTRPEVLLRSELHRRGLRFRKNVRLLTGSTSVRPDISFSRLCVAVFVDGCFWHRCPQHGTSPNSNPDYWRHKLEGNVDRDAAVNAALAEAGWRVVRVWEHTPLQQAAREIEEALDLARESRRQVADAPPKV